MCRGLIYLVSCVLVLGWVGSASADLMAYWSLDEGTGSVVYDRSGNSNNGTVHGATWGQGWHRGALEFNGVDSYVEIPTSDSIEIDDNVTIVAWIKYIDAGDGWLCVMANGQQGGPWENYGLFVNRTSRFVYFTLALDGTHVNQQSPNNVIEPDTWHHVSGTWDGATARIFVDGTMVLEQAQAGTLTPSEVPLRLGHRIGSSHYYNGTLDDAAVFDHALTEQEIQAAMVGIAPAELADDPNPQNEAIEVLRDTDLSWAPGDYAVTHDVYFGAVAEDVNDATRTDPRGVLLSEAQSGTTYDLPDTLDFDTTYYWRIDEVNGSPDFTIFKGLLWSFTTELFAYPVQGVVATSNTTSQPGNGPDRLVDRSGLDADDLHDNDTANMWTGTPMPGEVSYLQFDFPRVEKLHEMLVWNYNMQFETFLGYGVREATIEYSENGTDWTTLGDFTLAQGPGVATGPNNAISLDGVAASAVRMTINTNFAGGNQTLGLSEVRFLAIPVLVSQPDPADGATDVAVDATLSWRPGREAVSHEVYVGGDPNALEMAGAASQSTYTPDELELGETVYWQIVEVNTAETPSAWAGPVWSFSTQPYVEIDGFETYDDDVEGGTVIWKTWVDGIDDSTNGDSQVGYDQSPFAEQTIVHTGGQSMPFLFNNETASDISECDRTFATPQDWTVHGIRSLSLWFYGATENTGSLYVKVNGVKVAYDGQADDIAEKAWQPWNIDLSTVATDLASVTQLTIGVEGLGQGLVYIDDVRLYPDEPAFLVPSDPGADNLVGYWSFDEGAGTVAVDSSGNGHDATIESALWEDGTLGSALRFDGFSTYADVPAAAWDTIERQATLTAWMFIDSSVTQSPYTFAAFRDPANTYTRVFSAHVPYTDSVLYFDTGGDGTDFDRINKSATTDDYGDAWIHWAFVKNADTGRQMIYRNGRLWHSGAGLTRTMTGVTAFVLGANAAKTGGFWNGAMDDVRLYNRALSPEEVLWLAGETAPAPKPF